MDKPFIIHIDCLSGGDVQKIDACLSPDLFEVKEEDLSFPDPVILSGETYLADDELILRFNAKTSARMPCSICNTMIPILLAVNNYYHAVPLDEIKHAVFDLREIVRAALLLEQPLMAECSDKDCPERESIKPYLRKETMKENDPPTYFPFADLK